MMLEEERCKASGGGQDVWINEDYSDNHLPTDVGLSYVDLVAGGGVLTAINVGYVLTTVAGVWASYSNFSGNLTGDFDVYIHCRTSQAISEGVELDLFTPNLNAYWATDLRNGYLRFHSGIGLITQTYVGTLANTELLLKITRRSLVTRACLYDASSGLAMSSVIQATMPAGQDAISTMTVYPSQQWTVIHPMWLKVIQIVPGGVLFPAGI